MRRRATCSSRTGPSSPSQTSTTPSSRGQGLPAGSIRSNARPASTSPGCGGQPISQLVGESVRPGLQPESRARRATVRLSRIGWLERVALVAAFVLAAVIVVLPYLLPHGPLDLVDVPL